MDFVALDFETANEQRGSACAVGIAIIQGGRVVQTQHQLIRPQELRFSPWNVRIHGITEDDVVDAPTLPEIWPSIFSTLDNRLIVAHNASFDMSVLRHALYANDLPIPELWYLCSLQLSRMAWPELASHSLSFLAACHSIELDHHNAESDAKAASEIVLKIGREQAVDCPVQLAHVLEVTIGRLFPDGDWVPSSALGFGTVGNRVEFRLPEDFDITAHPLFGKTVAFTGALQFFTRSDAFQIVEACGGMPKNTISKKTDILVTGIQDLKKLASGENESSKLKKAKDLRLKGGPIQIITDHEFQQLVLQVAEEQPENGSGKDE